MKKPSKDNPAQLTFAVFCPAVIQATGDGYTVKPGKPILRMTPAQFAAQFAVDRDTIYRWIDDGTIDPKFVFPAGKRKLIISAEAVPSCQAKFAAIRA